MIHLFHKNFSNNIQLYADAIEEIESFSKNLKKKQPFPGTDFDNLSTLCKYIPNGESIKQVLTDLKNLKPADNSDVSSINNGEIKEKVGTIIASFKEMIGKYESSNEAYSLIFKYGTFIANIANAESADEVQSVIEATVLPAGSYRIKREAFINVEVNSYLGGNALVNPDLNDYGRVNGVYGFYAPVGIAISKGLPFNKGWETSLSIYLSLFDVGALTQFRLNDTDSTIQSNITLANLWSPGANIVLGIPKTPFSIGFGYQSRPNLSAIKKDGTLQLADKNPSFGWHASLSVDIPIFNLYTTPRSKKKWF